MKQHFLKLIWWICVLDSTHYFHVCCSPNSIQIKTPSLDKNRANEGDTIFLQLKYRFSTFGMEGTRFSYNPKSYSLITTNQRNDGQDYNPKVTDINQIRIGIDNKVSLRSTYTNIHLCTYKHKTRSNFYKGNNNL